MAELRAQGLGQRRDHPVPVPADLPRLNAGQRPVLGGNPWLVFVNFDGATLTGGADDSQQNITQIQQLAGDFAPYGDDPEMKAAILQAVSIDFGEYNINVVDTRPETGEYAMTMVGPTNPFGGGVLGIAPLDCANGQTHGNISYAFHSAGDGFDATTTAATISHEQGHAFGLDHVDNELAILNPFNAGGDPTFGTDCLPLTDGPGALCVPVHQMYCPDGTTQNSHLELLALFGPAVPDIDGPTITITAPLTGTAYEEGGDFTVLAEIIDDSVVEEAALYSNGELIEVDTTEPWGWQITNAQAGLYTLEIVAVDEFGNEGLSNPVSILVEGDDEPIEAADSSGGIPGGTGSTETAGLAPGNPSGCGCTEGNTPASPLWAGGLWLLALVRRRRCQP